MTEIEKLMRKYYTPDKENLTANHKWNKNENTSTEYRNRQRQETAKKQRHIILQHLLQEIPFYLNPSQVSQIDYLIDRLGENFKNLHRQSSTETILLALIMIQRKQQDKRINITKYSISRKYNLTHNKFESIQNQLIFELMRTTELVYSQSRYVNHEILEK